MIAKQRRERDSHVAKAAILAAAEEIFARDGFGAARVDAVAEAAGYNKSLIFQYFEDKQGLYRAVVNHCKERIEDDLILITLNNMQHVETIDAKQFRAILEAIIREYFWYQSSNPRRVRILAWEVLEGARTFIPLPPTEEPYSFRNKLTRISDVLEKARTQGIIRPEIDPILLFAHILNMCMFYSLSIPRYQAHFPERDFSSPEALGWALEQIVLIVLHGVMAPEETMYADELPLAGHDSPGVGTVYGRSGQYDCERGSSTNSKGV